MKEDLQENIVLQGSGHSMGISKKEDEIKNLLRIRFEIIRFLLETPQIGVNFDCLINS